MTTPKIIRNSEGITYEPIPTERLTLKITSADTDNTIDYVEATIGYLGGPPLHIHHDQDELFHILEGELRMQVGEEMVDLGPGDIAFCPRGTPYTFTNLNPEPVHMVGFALGGGFDRYYADLMEALAINPDPIQLAEVSAKHNNQIVGPPLPVTLGLMEMTATAA